MGTSPAFQSCDRCCRNIRLEKAHVAQNEREDHACAFWSGSRSALAFDLDHFIARAARPVCSRSESDLGTLLRLVRPVFRADSVVLAISAEKDGNCGWSTPGSDAANSSLPWRGAQAAVARPYPAVTCHVGVRGRAPLPVMRNGPP